jgi:hypothetical protein
MPRQKRVVKDATFELELELSGVGMFSVHSVDEKLWYRPSVDSLLN